MVTSLSLFLKTEMKKLLYAFVLMGVIVVSLSSCKGKQSDATETLPAENSMVLTAQDTTITRGLVTTFMDRIVAGDKGAASQLLYTVDFDDENSEPYPMTEEQLARMDQMLSLPVTGYEIADCVFDTPESNEIRCRVFINDRISTNWYFKPVRYLGTWYLCIKDSAQGDRSLSAEPPAEVAR